MTEKPGPRHVTPATRALLGARWERLRVNGNRCGARRHRIVEALVGRSVSSLRDLTEAEGQQLLLQLTREALVEIEGEQLPHDDDVSLRPADRAGQQSLPGWDNR